MPDFSLSSPIVNTNPDDVTKAKTDELQETCVTDVDNKVFSKLGNECLYKSLDSVIEYPWSELNEACFTFSEESLRNFDEGKCKIPKQDKDVLAI